MMEFLQDINWSPLWISLKTGVVATTIAFFLGIFCARKIMKLKPGSRAVLDGILTMPLVLPPTVAGFFLLLIFSLRRSFGKFLLENFDFKVVQTWKGCVIAAAVIAFPLMYRNARRKPDLCRTDPGNERPQDLLESHRTGSRSGNRLRNCTCLCESDRRVRCNFHACRKHPRQDKNRFRSDRSRNLSRKL